MPSNKANAFALSLPIWLVCSVLFFILKSLLQRNEICSRPHYGLFLDSSFLGSLDRRGADLEVDRCYSWEQHLCVLDDRDEGALEGLTLFLGCLPCFDETAWIQLFGSMWSCGQLNPTYCPGVIYSLDLVHSNTVRQCQSILLTLWNT